MRKSANLFWPGLLLYVFAIALSGCAGSSSMNWWTTSPAAPSTTAGDPVPRVQNCIAINTGTPSKYVCNGKTYTSHELRKLREDAAGGTVASK
jgi:hypothetical protein